MLAYQRDYAHAVYPAINKALKNRDQQKALFELLGDIRRQQLTPQTIDDYFGFSERIPLFNEEMDKNAVEAVGISSVYEKEGIYKRIADFANVGEGELVMDIACGTAHLFAVMGIKKGIGIDVSPYVLDCAETVLRARGLPAIHHRNPHLSFDARRGLYPTGRDLRRKLDSDTLNLYCDNAMQLEVSRKALSRMGIKATVLVAVLADELGAHYHLEHIAQRGKPEYIWNPIYVATAVVQNAHKVLEHEGKLILGYKVKEGYTKEIVEKFDGVFKSISVQNHISIRLPTAAEGGHKSGSVSAMELKIKPSGSEKRFELLLIEAKQK